MRRGFVAAPLALVFASIIPAASAQETDCDAWAASAEAWPEVETILRQNYAYLQRVDDVDALFRKAAESAQGVTSLGELGTLAESLGYAFRDGHFHVRPVAGEERAWIPSSSDFWVTRSGERLIVADVRRGSVASAQGLRPGWEIIAMDGQPIGDLARAALAPVVDDPTPEQIEYAVNVVLAGRLGASRSFTFGHDGSTQVMALPPAQQALGEEAGELLTITDHIGPEGQRIARIRFNNSLGENDLIAAFDQAIETIGARADGGYILDLRNTPGGGNTTVLRAILGRFVSEKATYQIHDNHYEAAVFGVPRQYAEYVFARGDGATSLVYRPVVVLAGYWTGSVGEALALALDRTANVQTVGTPLADLLGTLNTNSTRNSCLTLSFAWDRLSASDGTPREDWEPAILLPSADTAPDGSDPALAAALAASSAEEARD